MTNLELKLVA